MSTSESNPDAEIIALADAIMAGYERTRQLDELGEAAAEGTGESGFGYEL